MLKAVRAWHCLKKPGKKALYSYNKEGQNHKNTNSFYHGSIHIVYKKYTYCLLIYHLQHVILSPEIPIGVTKNLTFNENTPIL